MRGLRDDVSGLKSSFGKEGYVAEKGAFIISIWNYAREEILVSEKYVQEWDAIWKEVNDEFERDVGSNPRLAALSNRMFFVWDGNHRLCAWQSAIKERFSRTREKHQRILCTVIDPCSVSEIALLSTLQRMN